MTKPKPKPRRKIIRQPATLTAAERCLLRGHYFQLAPLENCKQAGLKIRTARGAAARLKKLLARRPAQHYLDGLAAGAEALAEKSTLLTIAEKREFCAATLRTSPAGLPVDSPLIQKYRISESESERGSSKTEAIEMMAKKDAIILDNLLAGHTHPEEKMDVFKAFSDVFAELSRTARNPLPEDKMS